MLIDDEPWSRKVIKQLGEWEKHGLTVVGEADDGSEGLRLIEELLPDIVVTDMRMPGVDGVELLLALNKNYPALKIIVMSGYDDFVYLKQAIKSQARDYLLKPVDPIELNHTLAKCVSELNQTPRSSTLSSIRSFLLSDSKFLDQYLEYRNLLHGYLLDLNASGVKQSINNLKQLLEREQLEDSKVKEIERDLTQLLENITGNYEIDVSQWDFPEPSKKSVRDPFHTLNETIGAAEQRYMRLINELEELRSKKHKIDMSEVQNYIHRNYKEGITLESIADYFYISKEHLSRSFKTFSGDTVTDYINRKRMEKAKQLIVEHKLSIKHAAEMTGYTDLAYFYRVFKKHNGFTPGELRKPKD